MTLKEIVPKYIEYKKKLVRPSTISIYAYTFEKHLVPYFGNFNTVNSSDVQKFIFIKIDEGLKRTTVQDMIVVLDTCLKWAGKNKYIKYEKFDVEYPGKRTREKVKTYSEDQSKKLQDFLIENLTFRNLCILITLHSGMRIGEVCGLKYSDVDLEKGVFNVNRTVQRISMRAEGSSKSRVIVGPPKTESSKREIPISQTLQEIFLKILPKLVYRENFISSNSGKPVEPRVFRNWHKAIQSHLNLPNLKFHGLRHTFATRLLQKKVDIKTVSGLLGHSNASTTLDIYVHTDIEQKKSAIYEVF